jgi:hypothetical protein
MPASESIAYVGLFLLAGLVALLPVHVAAIYAYWRRHAIPRKRTFVVVCALFSYGIGGLVGVFFLPIELASLFLVPQWQHDGQTLLAAAIRQVSAASLFVPASLVLLASFVAPSVVGRRWARICAGLA